MKTTFLTKAASKTHLNVDWVVLAAFVLGMAVILLTSIGGLLNGLSLQLLDEVGGKVAGDTTQAP